jgi:DNA uptake protein ComE-like DNA-binding protein
MIAAFVILVLGCCTAWAADPATAGSAPAKPASNLRLNLNAASANDFAQLPGVSAAQARAIAKGRPYRSKEELVTRKILPAPVYEEIKSNVFAGHSR